LVTLNDPTFVEAEKIMGEQIASSSDYKKGIVNIYRKLTGLTPNKSELELLEKSQSNELKKMRADIKKTKGWLSAGQYVVNKNIEPALIAANAVVASVILNSDATLTKR
jgi:pyridoxal/pyridoxine/pyridoxamine kinase